VRIMMIVTQIFRVSISSMYPDISDMYLKKYVKEMHRILSPGGRFVLISMHPVDKVAPYFVSEDLPWTVRIYPVSEDALSE